MKLLSLSRSLVLAVGVAMLGAGAAFADDIFTARLEAPTAESRVAVRSTTWSCEGDSCVARPNHAVSVSACRALVREVGPVAAYGTDERQLTAEQIAACNVAARPATQTQQAQSN